jgi:hypothetical protein
MAFGTCAVMGISYVSGIEGSREDVDMKMLFE